MSITPEQMKEPITFFVPGKPQPAGSKRAFVIKRAGAYTGRAIVTDANPKSKDWKTDVRHEAQRQYSGEPWDCPINLTLNFIVERPAFHFGSGKNRGIVRASAPALPTKKPDTTKLCRGVEDALTSILWRDDAQIVSQTITKRYGDRPGVEVSIREEWEEQRPEYLFTGLDAAK